MALVEPWGVFFNTEVFAVLATIDGVPNIAVIYGDPYEEEELIEGAEVSIVLPIVNLPVGTKNGDAVSVKGRAYTIISMQQGGQGLNSDDGTVSLMLHEN